jgi:hypothetical protein
MMKAEEYDMLRDIIYQEGPYATIDPNVIAGRLTREVELATNVKLPRWFHEVAVQIILRERGVAPEQDGGAT